MRVVFSLSPEFRRTLVDFPVGEFSSLQPPTPVVKAGRMTNPPSQPPRKQARRQRLVGGVIDHVNHFEIKHEHHLEDFPLQSLSFQPWLSLITHLPHRASLFPPRPSGRRTHQLYKRETICHHSLGSAGPPRLGNDPTSVANKAIDSPASPPHWALCGMSQPF